MNDFNEINLAKSESGNSVSVLDSTNAHDKPKKVVEKIVKGKKVKVVIEKNYPVRNGLMGFVSFPLLLLFSTVLVVPFVLLNNFTFAIGLILTVAAELLVITLALAYTGSLKDWRTKLRLRNFNWRWLILGFGIGVSMYFILQFLAIGSAALGFEVGSSDTSVSLGDLGGVERVILLFIAAPFIVPMVEEIFFRGYTMGFIQDAFKNPKLGAWIGVIFSSVVFGLAHAQGFSSYGDVFLIVWTGIIALVNALLMLKFKSLYPSFALHMGYNGVTVLATVFL